MNAELSYLTSSEEEYLSSDGEHLYMAPSPRSNSTTSPGSHRPLQPPTSIPTSTPNSAIKSASKSISTPTSTSASDSTSNPAKEVTTCSCGNTSGFSTSTDVATLSESIKAELERVFPQQPVSAFEVSVEEVSAEEVPAEEVSAEEVVEGETGNVEAKAWRNGRVVARALGREEVMALRFLGLLLARVGRGELGDGEVVVVERGCCGGCGGRK